MKESQEKRSDTIKNTIEKLTEKIIESKQSIIEDIKSIHNFSEENKKSVQHRNGIRF